MAVAERSAARMRKGELGQFLTPAPVADFMAALFGPVPDVVRLLDAGAGAGGLTAAFVSRICKKMDGVRAIAATVFEIDPAIQGSLVATMRDCHHRCARASIRFEFSVNPTDFIQEMSARLAGDLFGTMPPAFNVAIVNPPYRKIGTDSAERRALRSVGVETSNLYTAFVALIHRLLVPGGQVVGITPRSFCNGLIFVISATICSTTLNFTNSMFLIRARPRFAMTRCCRKTLFSTL
jgi:adenine-specific DNA-methyltransferase